MRLIVHVELSGDCGSAEALFPIVNCLALALDGMKDLGVTDYIVSYNTHARVWDEKSKKRFNKRWQKRLEEQS